MLLGGTTVLVCGPGSLRWIGIPLIMALFISPMFMHITLLDTFWFAIMVRRLRSMLISCSVVLCRIPILAIVTLSWNTLVVQ